MNIKKPRVKSAKIKKDYGIDLDTVILKNQEIDATELDGEVVMMNLDKGQYFMMNQVGSRIWGIIGEPIKVSKVIDTLLGEFEVESKECEETVVEFLGKLKHAELISAS